MSGVRHNLTPTRLCVRCISTTADMIMLQVCPPRTIESMLVTKKKYFPLLYISNSPQTKIHDRKDRDILEGVAECLDDLSMDSCATLWENVSILYPLRLL